MSRLQITETATPEKALRELYEWICLEHRRSVRALGLAERRGLRLSVAGLETKVETLYELHSVLANYHARVKGKEIND